jgi:hypothetical protein
MRRLLTRHLLLFVSFAGIAFVAALWVYVGMRYPNSAYPDRFEGLNALFAGLAFAVLIAALLLQSRELQLQRKELRLTRRQVRGQKKELALQNITMRRQAFETTFFQLLSLHGDILRAIDLSNWGIAPTAPRGREAFRELYVQLESHFANLSADVRDKSLDERASVAYLRFFETFQSQVGHYFRNLYHIVRFVHETEFLTASQKRLYTRLVRAQLSSYELVLLFYNCLAVGLGKEDFKPLVEEYSLLKNLPLSLLFDAQHKELFWPTAYVRNRERALFGPVVC